MRVVFSIIRLFPAPRNRAEVIELLRSVQDLARPSVGCVGCWISEEDFLHNHIRYAEQWETEDALHEHIRSDLYRRVLAAMELSKQEPEVRFYYCSQSKGLELIEAARREAKVHEPASGNI
jgi:quinol monooxygenase YgiN